MRRRNGFTLIELLVVIAIIAILAAIIFPVYAQAKKAAYKSSDLSNMNALRTALQLYKADNGAFPPALLGYVGPYSNLTSGGANVIPPNAVKDALYAKRVESISVFRPALNRVLESPGTSAYDTSMFPSTAGDSIVTGAYWPGTGSETAGSSAQRFGSSDKVMRATHAPGSSVCQAVPSYYYRVSGYDVAPASNLSGAKMESHYQLFWTGWTVPGDPCNVDTATEAGSAMDDPRQLGYSDPPETTVVTWDPFFRDYTNGVPQHQKQDLVLFLAGNARPMDSASVYTSAWGTKP